MAVGTIGGNLNQSFASNIDAASNQVLYIAFNYSVPVYIKHINYGVTLLTTTARANFGWVSVQVIRNMKFDSGTNWGNFEPAPGQNVAYFDSIVDGKGKAIDFSSPIEIKANENVLIVVTPPTGITGAGGIGGIDTFLTVLADFGKDSGASPTPRPFGQL